MSKQVFEETAISKEQVSEVNAIPDAELRDFTLMIIRQRDYQVNEANRLLTRLTDLNERYALLKAEIIKNKGVIDKLPMGNFSIYFESAIRKGWNDRENPVNIAARARGSDCVVVQCDEVTAVMLSIMVTNKVIADPSALAYDGGNLSMYFGHAGGGGGVENCMDSAMDIIFDITGVLMHLPEGRSTNRHSDYQTDIPSRYTQKSKE